MNALSIFENMVAITFHLVSVICLHVGCVDHFAQTAACTVFPLIFHSIKDEIPENHQQTMTRLFQLWLVLAVTLIVNLVAMILVVVSGGGDGARDLSGAITYVAGMLLATVLLTLNIDTSQSSDSSPSCYGTGKRIHDKFVLDTNYML